MTHGMVYVTDEVTARRVHPKAYAEPQPKVYEGSQRCPAIVGR
jgi:hypothetical protein